MSANQDIFLADQNATEHFAQALAQHLQSTFNLALEGDRPPAATALPFKGMVIHLYGDLGAGKTTFARAFLRAMGVAGRIKSPTYTLLETYKVSRLYLYHFDFYRFNNSDEWQEAGFEEQLIDQAEQAVVLVEWPDKAGPQLPSADIEIHLSYQDPGRKLGLRTHTEQGSIWLTRLIADGLLTADKS
ncbi:tRNA (adenosine(37)-N6)-threonylcarbamoyltransferase complex ATPase subunit type 1 TsaE [Brackiella oedipodis]|uniref:tRNA (adenosine(37)-N6)-threonylcarbamoyltransferase complex ATPase subunit type 1 TsaE n=1 Tax=Brackiella oedipodis TaxID=124225 RepID=UPI00048AA056|nr:tRNA (adenosine(37)-N6)-threonylcarbamoyltransferase complex ATPase subunit type 1 TsaE [Brackiella oedipodis]